MKKKIIFILLMFCIVSTALFADGGIKELDDWGTKLLNLFSSTWVKAICAIALIIICIGMITVGRQEQGMIKKFVPWLVGVIVLLSASSIVGYMFQGSDFTNGLTSFLQFVDIKNIIPSGIV